MRALCLGSTGRGGGGVALGAWEVCMERCRALREESSATRAGFGEGVDALMAFVAPSIWSGSCSKV